MRYYIIAGERSGDLHGSNLVRALRKLDPEAVLRGFGGEYMEQAGVTLKVHYNEIALMGLLEFIVSLPKMIRYIKRCTDDIAAFKPDVIILIDYGGFNRRIAKYGKKQGIKVFYYIPPKIWAWYQRRALEIKANVDKLFVILPFEKDFYKKYDWEVDYVGNPVLDAVKAHKPDNTFLEKEKLLHKENIIALLPGSRRQELKSILPVMGEVVRAKREYQFVVAAVENLDHELYSPLAGLPNVTFVYDKTYDLLQHAKAAIVTSGTATLETALFRVPQMVVYKPGAFNYWLAKKFIRVAFISLVNLIADREVVRELIHHEANQASMTHELEELLHGSRRAEVLAGYQQVTTALEAGGSASENTAKLMWKYLCG